MAAHINSKPISKPLIASNAAIPVTIVKRVPTKAKHKPITAQKSSVKIIKISL